MTKIKITAKNKEAEMELFYDDMLSKTLRISIKEKGVTTTHYLNDVEVMSAYAL